MIDLQKTKEQLINELESLRKENENYKLIIDHQRELLIKVDINGKLLFANKAYSNILGKEVEELLNRSFLSFICEDDRENTFRKLQKVFTAPYCCYVEQRACKRNSDKWFGWEYTAVLDQNYNVTAIVGVGRDITSRKRTEKTLRQRLNFERTLKTIFSRFVNVHDIDKAINLSLADMGHLSGADRVYLFLLPAHTSLMSNTHEWCAPGVPPQIHALQNLPCKAFPWWMDKLQKGEVIHVPDVSLMPLEAKAEREILESQKIKSVLVLPVNKANQLTGFIGFDEVNKAIDWKEDEFDLLRVAAGIIGNALQRQEYEMMLRQSEQQYRTIFENTGAATVIIEENTVISLANAEFEALSGFSRGELEGKKSFESFFTGDDLEKAKRYHYERRQNPLLVPQNYETRMLDREGQIKHVMVSVAMLPGTQKSVASFLDITERKHVEQKLQYLSFFDSLTGLYNRTFFEAQMKRMEKSRNRKTGLIICDVDGLKLINDTLGHHTGDDVLKTVANIFKDCFGPNSIIARIGGDEFAILLPGSSRSLVNNTLLRITDIVSSYNQSNPKVLINISIGCAFKEDYAKTMDELFREADNNMYKEKLHHVQSTRNALVQTLKKALEARDFITEGHADRVLGMVLRLAKGIGYSNGSLADLRLFAQFHDLGKVGLPDGILFKQGPLTDTEFKEMQRHCEIGYRIAHSAVDLIPIADWILKHHEWWNGSGYPLGIKGEEIPLECRILAIADAYDAMVSDRPYRKAMSHESALRELKRCAGTQFDPQLIKEFVHVIDKAVNN